MNTPKQTFRNGLTSNPARGKITANERRFLCPVCKRATLLFLLPTTEVKDLPVLCKRCGAASVVNISPEPEP